MHLSWALILVMMVMMTMHLSLAHQNYELQPQQASILSMFMNPAYQQQMSNNQRHYRKIQPPVVGWSAYEQQHNRAHQFANLHHHHHWAPSVVARDQRQFLEKIHLIQAPVVNAPVVQAPAFVEPQTQQRSRATITTTMNQASTINSDVKPLDNLNVVVNSPPLYTPSSDMTGGVIVANAPEPNKPISGSLNNNNNDDNVVTDVGSLTDLIGELDDVVSHSSSLVCDRARASGTPTTNANANQNLNSVINNNNKRAADWDESVSVESSTSLPYYTQRIQELNSNITPAVVEPLSAATMPPPVPVDGRSDVSSASETPSIDRSDSPNRIMFAVPPTINDNSNPVTVSPSLAEVRPQVASNASLDTSEAFVVAARELQTLRNDIDRIIANLERENSARRTMYVTMFRALRAYVVSIERRVERQQRSFVVNASNAINASNAPVATSTGGGIKAKIETIKNKIDELVTKLKLRLSLRPLHMITSAMDTAGAAVGVAVNAAQIGPRPN